MGLPIGRADCSEGKGDLSFTGIINLEARTTPNPGPLESDLTNGKIISACTDE
jgi:hypothetical protein